MQIELIFVGKLVHLASFWKWGFLGLPMSQRLSGLLTLYFAFLVLLFYNEPGGLLFSVEFLSLPVCDKTDRCKFLSTDNSSVI